MEEDLKKRYARQIAIKEIGHEGQRKLCEARIMVVGCGALGSMVAMQLAGAGIGTIGIADFDTIDISNLQRQFFFKTQDTGKLKLNQLANSIKELNPGVEVKLHSGLITERQAESIFKEYDFIVDATDNPESKRMTGDVSNTLGKACCIGGVSRFGGQVMTLLPDYPRLEDYFGSGVSEGFLPCSMDGVIGPAAAICASVQASEVIKYVTGSGELLSGKIFTFNLFDNSFHIFHLA